ICDQWRREGLVDLVRQRTGLVIDAYFSASKIRWLLDHLPGLRARAERGEILFGTVDSWLIWQLTGSQSHVTDLSNASRTMLFNIHQRQWDEELLRIMQIPAEMMPRVVSSSGIIATARKDLLGAEIPIAGIAGDQQAALFGQTCFAPGEVKN